jgi:hypothetical protein
MDGIWSLQGPARFASAARVQLDRGNSVLAGLPAVLSEDPAFHAGLRRAIGYDFYLVDGTVPEDRPVSSVVAEGLGLDDVHPGPDAAVTLARHPALAGRHIAISVSGKPAEVVPWADFIRAFLAAARAIPTDCRPLLLIIGGHPCATALAGADPLAEAWWWGVLDRLDTASYIQARLPGQERNDLLRDAITEVVGFDLELAGYLLSEWDGDGDTLGGLLDDFTGPGWPDIRLPDPLPSTSTPLGAPPAALLDMWDRGMADGWDTFGVYLHPCVISAPEARARIWRAQIRCLMPMIDEERSRIEAWMRQEVRGLPAGEVLEPGGLYDVMLSNPRLKAWRGGHRKRLVCWLRDARNTLAHMGTLPPEVIAEGHRLIRQDRKQC